MTWLEVKKTLTTPPPPRRSPPKSPLFTTDPFSTTSLGPGHLVGAGVLVFGLYSLTKFFVARGQAQAEEVRRLAEQPRRARRPEDEPKIAQEKIVQVENARGQYEKRGP